MFDGVVKILDGPIHIEDSLIMGQKNNEQGFCWVASLNPTYKSPALFNILL